MSSEKKDKPEIYTFETISSSHLWFLRLASFFPLKNKRFTHPLSLLLQLWDLFMVTTYIMMWTGFLIRQIARRQVKMDHISEEMVVQTFSLRYLLLYLKRKQLSHLVNSCRKLWSYLKAGEDIIVRQFERKGCFLWNLIMINSLLAATSFIIRAHFTRLPPLEPNGTERRMLPFRFFMDVQKEPAFRATYALQVICCYFIAVMFASVETVSLHLIMMACGYLRSIRIRLTNYKGSDSNRSKKSKDAFEMILGCAHFHQQIMIFCEEVERMTGTLFFFACFCPVYNLSMLGIKILDNDEEKFKFILLLVMNLFQFFTCHWAPGTLVTESETIAEAAYFASLRPQASIHREKINQILFFMMMRAQKPVQLTAGGIARLSIETFGAMIKSAFSFFMVLRSFRN